MAIAGRLESKFGFALIEASEFAEELDRADSVETLGGVISLKKNGKRTLSAIIIGDKLVIPKPEPAPEPKVLPKADPDNPWFRLSSSNE